MKITAIILGVVVVAILAVLLFVPAPKRQPVQAVPAAMAISSDGHVRVDSPRPGDAVDSPLIVNGTVTGGGWFFEASFPVKVFDADGTVLGTGQAESQPAGNWTSTGTVVFVADIALAKSHSATGTVVLSKDDPSGLPANSESLSIPVKF